MSSPVHRFVFTRRVEFADTDAAGIMHFSNFFRFMEVAEHAFYRSLGFTVHEFRPDADGPRIGWPRVHAEADFRLPLRFEEEVEIELLVEEVRSRSIRYLFRFWKNANGTRQMAATGRFSVACVSMEGSREGMKAIPIPENFKAKLEAAPKELLEAPAN